MTLQTRLSAVIPAGYSRSRHAATAETWCRSPSARKDMAERPRGVWLYGVPHRLRLDELNTLQAARIHVKAGLG